MTGSFVMRMMVLVRHFTVAPKSFIVFQQRDPEEENPGPSDFLPIGIEMAVGRLLSMPDGSSSALVQGRRRVEISEFTQEKPFMLAHARRIYEDVEVAGRHDRYRGCPTDRGS
jgi:ATP-dependent Lon protease